MKCEAPRVFPRSSARQVYVESFRNRIGFKKHHSSSLSVPSRSGLYITSSKPRLRRPRQRGERVLTSALSIQWEREGTVRRGCDEVYYAFLL
jgi:hypothetical protein